MEFFLEMLLTAVVALLFSYLVAKLVSVANGGGGDHPTSDQAEKSEIGVGGDGFATEELMKMDAPVIESERNFQVVDENVELVDRFENEADRLDEVEETVTGNANVPAEREELVVLILTAVADNVIAEEVIVRGQDEQSDLTEEVNGEIGAKCQELVVSTAEAESTAAVITEEVIVRGQDQRSDSAEQISAECEELMVRTREAESIASISPENVVVEETLSQGTEKRSETTEESSGCVENEESGDVVVAESEEVKVEESNTVEESDSEGEDEEKKELSIEDDDDDDDWEGIERSELEKAFVAASNLLAVESEKAEEIGADAKMELYGLHKIATEGPCRETQPMAIMASARAKWNAWQKLGNMNQEEAMEKYLALISKEIPALINTVGKMPEMETTAVLPPNSGTTLDTTGVDSSKMFQGKGESSV